MVVALFVPGLLNLIYPLSVATLLDEESGSHLPPSPPLSLLLATRTVNESIPAYAFNPNASPTLDAILDTGTAPQAVFPCAILTLFAATYLLVSNRDKRRQTSLPRSSPGSSPWQQPENVRPLPGPPFRFELPPPPPIPPYEAPESIEIYLSVSEVKVLAKLISRMYGRKKWRIAHYFVKDGHIVRFALRSCVEHWDGSRSEYVQIVTPVHSHNPEAWIRYYYGDDLKEIYVTEPRPILWSHFIQMAHHSGVEIDESPWISEAQVPGGLLNHKVLFEFKEDENSESINSPYTVIPDPPEADNRGLADNVELADDPNEIPDGIEVPQEIERPDGALQRARIFRAVVIRLWIDFIFDRLRPRNAFEEYYALFVIIEDDLDPYALLTKFDHPGDDDGKFGWRRRRWRAVCKPRFTQTVEVEHCLDDRFKT